MEPGLQVSERAFRQGELSRHLATRRSWQRRHDTEGDVRRLVVRRIGVRHVIRESANCRRARWRRRRLAFHKRCRVQAGDQSRCGRLDVAFDAGHLAGEEHRGADADLPRFGEHRGTIHVGIAVHHSETDKLRLLESRDEPQDARLIAPLDLRLEADEAEVIAGQVVLPELHGRVRLAARSRIGETDRFHRSEPQRVAAAMRHHLDRQAPFEKPLLVEVVHGRRFGRDERVVETIVLFARQRAVQVVAFAIVDAARGLVRLPAPRFADGKADATGVGGVRLEPDRANAAIPPRRAEDFRPIDRLREDNRADRVVEIQMVAADQLRDVRGQRVRRQRSGGNDDRRAVTGLWNRGHLLADDRDERVIVQRGGDGFREPLAIDGQRRARGHPARLGRALGALLVATVRSVRTSGGCLDEFLAANVIAVVVVAEDLPAVFLRRLLDQVRRAALRAFFVDRPVPEDEVAVRIVRAAEEDLAAARLALDDLAALVAVLRTDDTGRLVLDVLALGIARARGELAEPSLLDHQIGAAARTLLVENLIGFRRFQPAVLGRDQLSRRLALGIAGAREELAEAAALDRHRLAAVLARLDLLVTRLGIRLLLLHLARVRAVRIRAARDARPEPADALQHRRSAFVAGLADVDPFLEIVHFLAGSREVLLELLVEVAQGLHVIGLALLDLVEIVLERSRVLDVDDVVEALRQQVADDDAERGWLEPAFNLVHVVAILQHADDRRVRARAADAVLFQFLDQCGLGESRRRLRELLLGTQRLQLEPIAFGQLRQDARDAVFVFPLALERRLSRSGVLAFPWLRLARREAVGRHPAGELRHGALDTEHVVAGRDVDRCFIERRGIHLRRDEAIPDQPVKGVLIRREKRLHRLGIVLQRRRPDRLVRALRVRFRLVVGRLLRHILVAERRLDVIADRERRCARPGTGAGASVGEETAGQLGDLDPALVQLLRDHHRLFDREARRLLELARDERRRRMTLALLGDHRRHGPRRALEIGEDGLRLLLVGDRHGIAALLEQLRFDLRWLRAGEPREDVPVLFGHEPLDLALAIAHQLQGDRLDAAGAETAAHLVPEQRTELVADESIEHAACALRVDHLLVDDARLLDRGLNRLLRDLVERQAVNLALASAELLRQMPADRFAFAIGVGRHVDVRRVLRRILQLFDHLLARGDRFVLLGEVVLDVHTQFALRQVADVTHRRDDLVVASEVSVDGLRLGG